MRATNERFMRLCNIANLQPKRTNADLLSVAITLTALQIFRCLESLTPISQILKSFWKISDQRWFLKKTSHTTTSPAMFDKFWKVVMTWNPDVQSWNAEILQIPRQDASKNDQDDYHARKRLVEDLLNKNQLTRSVSINNFTGFATVEKQSQINCMWPTPEWGNKACHLLKYWEHLWRKDVRGIPVNLLTYRNRFCWFPSFSC